MSVRERFTKNVIGVLAEMERRLTEKVAFDVNGDRLQAPDHQRESGISVSCPPGWFSVITARKKILTW